MLPEDIEGLHLGIYGGSFDPVHMGHMKLARAALSQTEIDTIVFIPCAYHPHNKNTQACIEDRIAMLSLVIASESRFYMSDIEAQRANTSYTAETVERVHKSFPTSRLSFLMGEDSLKNFCSWRRWQDILNMVDLIVMRRSDSHLNLEQINSKLAANMSAREKITMLETGLREESSTAVREELARMAELDIPIESIQNSPLNDWLDPKVLNYILNKKIYQ